MRRGAAGKRRDATEKEIADALRKVGAFVVYISGDGCPDLLVNWRGTWLPIEVKSRKGRIREKQQAAQYPIARSVEDVLKLFGI